MAPNNMAEASGRLKLRQTHQAGYHQTPVQKTASANIGTLVGTGGWVVGTVPSLTGANMMPLTSQLFDYVGKRFDAIDIYPTVFQSAKPKIAAEFPYLYPNDAGIQ